MFKIVIYYIGIFILLLLIIIFYYYLLVYWFDINCYFYMFGIFWNIILIWVGIEYFNVFVILWMIIIIFSVGNLYMI